MPKTSGVAINNLKFLNMPRAKLTRTGSRTTKKYPGFKEVTTKRKHKIVTRDPITGKRMVTKSKIKRGGGYKKKKTIGGRVVYKKKR